MIGHIIEHWKTSIAGTALGGTVFALLQSGCGAKDWKSWAVAIGVAALGLVAKDPGSKLPPTGLTGIVLAAAALFFLVPTSSAQIQPPEGVVPNHVSISAQFSGYDSGGKMQAANLDIVQVPITKHFTADYDHISVPGIDQRWELGNVSYQNHFPKLKAVVWDTSVLQYQASAGLGKFLSSEDGNHLAWDVAGALQYPVSKLMGWQLIRFQYVYAIGTGGNIHGTISNCQISTGPVLRF